MKTTKTLSSIVRTKHLSLKEKCNAIEKNPFDNRLLSFEGWFSSNIKGLQIHEIKQAILNNRPARVLTITEYNTVAVL